MPVPKKSIFMKNINFFFVNLLDLLIFEAILMVLHASNQSDESMLLVTFKL